jgi:hypothetical protein
MIAWAPAGRELDVTSDPVTAMTMATAKAERAKRVRFDIGEGY